ILLDTTAPDTIIDSGPDSITNSTTALFTFHSPEAGSTFECKLDSGNFAPCSGTVEFSSLGDGSHTFAVRAIDAVGNVDQTPATHAWTIDSTAPVISNVTVVPSLANGTVRITITKTVTDATSVASVSATIKGPHPATSVVGFVNLSLQSGLYSATFDFPSQALAPDGVYTIEDTATDSLGNSITLDDGTITLDRTGASVTIVSIIPQVTQSANHVVVTVVAQDETSGFADQNAVTALDETINVPASFVSFSGSLAPGQIGTWVFNQPAGGPVVEGTHNEKVTAVDAAGNISHVTGTYVVDNTAPDTVIDSTPVTSANTPNATFTFHSTELNSSFLCQLDGGAFDACVSPKSYTALTDGQHSFVVKATDEAGNTDPTPASFIWSVDSTVPTGTVLINNGDAATKNTQVTLTLTCEDAGTGCAEMQISLDGMLDTETFEPFTTAKQVTLPPTDGNKTVLVLFKDTVGNVSSEASDTIILDTTAPDTVVDTAPASGATNTSATFTFHATEPTSTFMCKLDSGAFAACVSGVTFSGLSVGTHTFAVFATDAVGNEDASPADYIWNIKPVITDSDGDGVQDAVDQCINVQGPADRNGCPVADKINFTMNIVDQEKTGVCGYDQNGKPKENCTTPLQGAIVRIFDRDSAAFVSAYSSKRPAKDMSGIIFENGHGLVGQCTTDSTGTCLVGEDHAGKFMVIAKFVDGSTSIYTAIFKNFQRKVVSATQNSEDDDDIDDVQARALVIEKNMSITKKVKKNGQVEYSGSRVVTN
ncbi:MAG TPA: Ig-like domain-containing protein, partial [Patescibacteria group bacterium]|nr:Ig-like domain-containing protein [Patescibacteria group bacterium]